MGVGIALIARLAHRVEIGTNGGGGAKLTMAFAAAGSLTRGHTSSVTRWLAVPLVALAFLAQDSVT